MKIHRRTKEMESSTTLVLERVKKCFDDNCTMIIPMNNVNWIENSILSAGECSEEDVPYGTSKIFISIGSGNVFRCDTFQVFKTHFEAITYFQSLLSNAM